VPASVDPAEPEIQRWNAAAAGWTRWWTHFERGARPVSERLVELAAVAPGHTVLDVATGLGEPAITAARLVGPRGRVIATDCAPAMLREAARRAESARLSNIAFREMDAGTPNLDDIAFDSVLCRWGFMFVPDLEGSLRRLLALLRPGGHLATAAWGAPDEVPFIQLSASAVAKVAPLPDAAVSPLHPFRLSDRAILIGAMERAGFAEVSREEVDVTFEFASPQEYTRFRRDMTALDAMLAEHHPPEVVEAAWQAVSKAAGAYADKEGRVCFTNTAVCFSGSRFSPTESQKVESFWRLIW